MVATRSKTKRASTPLSSPPQTPSPSQHDAHASSPAPSISLDPLDTDIDDVDSDDSSDGDHEDYCDLHSNGLATHCNAFTKAGMKCTRKAKIFDAGYLPLCGTHEFACWYRTRKRAGRCQAMEECGHVCNRLALYAPPYHLCDEHDKGTTTLPCHFMRLPTELRLMVFQYLVPEEVSAHVCDGSFGAIMRVNREFYQVVSTIVYKQVKFKAWIDPTTINLFQRAWSRACSTNEFEDINKKLCQGGAQRIRNLEVKISFASDKIKAKGLARDISLEEYEVYQVRDTVRKLVQLLASPSSDSTSTALKQLRVRVAAGTQHEWSSDEVTSAVFLVLGPFAALGPIDDVGVYPPPRPWAYGYRDQRISDNIAKVYKSDLYENLRTEWLTSMRKSTGLSSSLDSPQKASRDTATVESAFRKIEAFANLIYKQDSAQSSGAATKHGWTATVFVGIERVLHVARMAYEEGYLEQLNQVHKAILKRWIKAHRQQQQARFTIATAISEMFDGGVASHHDTFPEAFEFDDFDPVVGMAKDDEYWPELDVKDINNIFSVDRDGITIKAEESLKVTLCKDGTEDVLLKTPLVFRYLRSLKAYIQQKSE